MTEEDYIAYFANLASMHAAIRHDDVNHKAFYVVKDDNMSELEMAIRNTLDYPALLLDQYFDELDTTSDNNRLRIEGGFSIIMKVLPGDVQSLRDARHNSRLLARSILNRIRKDIRFGGALSKYTLFMSPANAGEPTPVIAGGTATGWGYSLTWLMPTSIAVDPDDWLDMP